LIWIFPTFCGSLLRKPTALSLSVFPIIPPYRTMPLNKKLWIVETGRIRVHQAEDAETEKE
jgi:hypothetical protein